MHSPHPFARTASFTAATAVAATTAFALPPLHYSNEHGAASNEAAYVNLQYPSSFSVTAGAATPLVFGRIYQGGMTEAAGPNPSIVAQVGYGPIGSNPLVDDSGWIWFNAVFNVQYGNDDEYMASFTAPAVNGTYAYTYRFNLSTVNAGFDALWTLADLNGAGSNDGLNFDPQLMGVMTVTPTPGAAAALGLGALAGLRRRH